MKRDIGSEKYLVGRGWSEEIIEQCARLRYGNLEQEISKELKDERFKLCREGKKGLQHIWVCQKVRERIKKSG